MGKMIQYPEIEPGNDIPTEDPSGADIKGTTEYRDAVACLNGIVDLSPRTAHQLMRRIVGVYRNLVAIANGESERPGL